MFGRILYGFLSGIGLSTLALVAVSLVSVVPDEGARETAPSAAAVELPAGSGFDVFSTEKPANLPKVDQAREPVALARVERPVTEDSVTKVDESNYTTPEVAGLEIGDTTFEAPSIAQDGSGVESAAPRAADTLLQAMATAPTAPDDETTLNVATAPAARPAKKPEPVPHVQPDIVVAEITPELETAPELPDLQASDDAPKIIVIDNNSIPKNDAAPQQNAGVDTQPSLDFATISTLGDSPEIEAASKVNNAAEPETVLEVIVTPQNVEEPAVGTAPAVTPQSTSADEPVEIAPTANEPEPAPVLEVVETEVDEPEIAVQPDNTQAPKDVEATEVESDEVVIAQADTEVATAPQAVPEVTAVQLQADTNAEESSSVVGNIADGVVTDRLPSVGADNEAEPEVEVAAVEAPSDPAPAERDPSLPPIERFAVDFENPDGKPLLSIVLIDEQNSTVDPALLADFPYPVSVAVSAARSDAADRAGAYRQVGTEILAMADFPQNAGPEDAEVTMEIYLDAVPGAVAVMEGLGTGLQQSRKAGEQLAPILLESGHGLVLFGSGLNTLQKIIAREGVPSGVVFRDIDGQKQSEGMMRRTLDQAVFKAGQQEEGVVIVGRMRPDTINALVVWGLEGRAERVALAPVSAVLNPPAPVGQ
ncbi:MAG: divergent polysaccharide deacetylase family protein [Pseudomonadota bacterium]